MLRNINYNTINRNKVMWSTLFVPLAAPIFIVLIGIQTGSMDILSTVASFFLSIIFGAVFWIPTILIALLMEYLMIRENATEKHVAWTLIIEGIMAFFIIFSLIIDFETSQPFWLSVSLMLSIVLTQFMRWWYLKAKNRMFMSASPKQDDTVTDQYSAL